MHQTSQWKRKHDGRSTLSFNGRLGSPCKWKYIETAPLCANHLGLAVNLKIIWCSQKAVGWLGTQSLLPQIWVHFASSAGSFHRCVPETKKAGGELIVDRWQRCGSCPAECELNSQPADHGSLLQRGVVECSWATYRGVKWKSVIIRSELNGVPCKEKQPLFCEWRWIEEIHF